MSSSREYTWQPLKDKEADIWRKILDEQPMGIENGEQRPLHMLESAHSLDFVGDGSQSEVCVISYDDFLQRLPRRIGEIFANRSFLLYNCPSEGDSPSEHPGKDFEECIKRIRSGKALVHIQDGYVEQEADKGITIDMLEKLIPNEHFRNGKPRGNALQNLIPDHDHPAIIVPRLDQWAIHLRAVTHTADLPGLPHDDLPTEHLQWVIFGNNGVYTAEHVDAAGFTAVKVLNQTGEKAWGVQNSNLPGDADGRTGAYYSRLMYSKWDGTKSNGHLFPTEMLWLHHKTMLIMRPMTPHRVVGMSDTGTGGLIGHELQSIDHSIMAEIHGSMASEISTNTDHSDARWLFPRILIQQLDSMLRGEEGHMVLVLTDGVQLEKFVLLVAFNVILPGCT
ncbi:hypothetical protein C8F01DRAFT_757124 [Mycena amicta]|nr:hypothetical protein C8F01DRAFT_757124 [Mycena amicta]